MTDQTEPAGARDNETLAALTWLITEALPADVLAFVEEQHAEIQRLGARLDAARLNASDAERIAEGLRAERDLLLWLHAERSWQLDETRLDAEKYHDYLKMANRTTDRRGRERDTARAERDQLKARIDKALMECDLATPRGREWRYFSPFVAKIRASLQGAQPAEPDARTARSGPTPQGIPAESRSTMDSGDGPECICAGGRCDYDDHDNPLTGTECEACAELTDTSTCAAYEGDYIPGPPAPFVPASDAFPEERP